MAENIEKSIVVLPFLSLSGDIENEYFSDGMTEEIINALTKVDGLKVIARTSSFAFKGRNIDVRKIGKNLGVSTILEGSIRKSTNRLRITAQLIRAQDGFHIWSENYDRELLDVFELQDEISLKIAEKIRENFGHLNIQDHLVQSATRNIKAYEKYLEGRFYQLQWSAESLKDAITYYRKAVNFDPHYALPYYGMVQSYGLLALWGYMPHEEGIEEAVKQFSIAKDIDDSLPEYYMTFVGRTFWGEWDFRSAYKNIMAVLKISPVHTDALEAIAELMIANGEFVRAKEYLQKAMDTDPLSANHFYTRANISYLEKNYIESLTFLDQALALNPDLKLAKGLQLMCFIWLNNEEKFFEHFNEKDFAMADVLFYVINKTDNHIPINMHENSTELDKDENELIPFHLFVYANSASKKRGFEFLKKYIHKRRGQVINYRVEPFLQSLRQFDEFEELHHSNLDLNSLEAKSTKSWVNKPSNLDETKEQLNNLVEYLELQKPYLQSQISLSQMADELKLHANRLSSLINDAFQMNYNEFINSYRLKEFKQKALDPKNKHLTLLGLAFESGFNSKTVFNTYFKKKEGLSPKEWLKREEI